MEHVDWAAPADWKHRSADFRDLRQHQSGVVMEYCGALLPEQRDTWAALRHPNLLLPVEPYVGGLLLRYAAFNWTHRKLGVETRRSRDMVARWGVQLTTLFSSIISSVSKKKYWMFARPFALLDLGGDVRVGFHACARKSQADERTYVALIGELMRSLIEGDPPSDHGALIQRCMDPKPPTLDELEVKWRALAPPDPVRIGDLEVAWNLVEEAIGWLALDNLTFARRRLQAASIYPYYEHLTRSGLARTRELSVVIELEPEPPPPPPPTPPMQWPPAPPPPPPPTPAKAAYLDGKQHFLARRLYDARECFQRAIALDPLMLEAQLLASEVGRAIARTRSRVGTATAPVFELPASLAALRGVLLSGNTAAALAALSAADLASDAEAQLLRARFYTLDGQHERALELYQRWPSHAADIGIATALLDLGRADEALAKFEALLAADPRDLDALDGRARALERLGRSDEAEAAMRDYMATIEVGSDLRVRLVR